MAIDQRGAQPLSVQIRDDICARIRSEEFQVGQRVPSLRALVSLYGVAEPTVHAAIRELQSAGILESTSGRGTFVRRVPDEVAQPETAAIASLQAEVAGLRERVEALEQRRNS